MRDFEVIVAACNNNGIGSNKTIPWRLSPDMKEFRIITTNTKDSKKLNAIIMGRTTWESIPLQFRPLIGRINIVVSRTLAEPDDILPMSYPDETIDGDKHKTYDPIFTKDLISAIEIASSLSFIDKIFIGGGGGIYREALAMKQWYVLPFMFLFIILHIFDSNTIHLTRVHGDYTCDVFFPQIDDNLYEHESSSSVFVFNDIKYSFERYIRKM